MANVGQGQMEIKATFTIPFTQVQNTVIDSTLFENPIDKIVYISLLRFAFNKGAAFPSISTLAKMNSSSDNRIRQSIKRLEKMSLITVEKRKRNDKEFQSNLYHIHDLPPIHEEHSIMNMNNKKNTKKQGTSKNEVGTSNIEVGGTSKNEVGTSKIEGEEEELNNTNNLIKNNNNNLSINEGSIQKMDVPIAIQKQLILNIDRLIDDKISLENIEMNYKANTGSLNAFQYAEVLSNVLKKTKGTINDISSIMAKSIKNYLKQLHNTNEQSAVSNESRSTEVIPDWFRELKDKKKREQSKQTSYNADYSTYNFGAGSNNLL